MCGIVGFIDTNRGRAAADLEREVRTMADVLRHRGPDGDGTWTDADAGVALGHRRLAIIDLSAEGRQPMVSASGRYVISYNGEVYNFPDLRSDLEASGASFRGHSDTEVMLAAIEKWGLEAAVGRFIGMFAFALWDRKTRSLHLVRDRLGIKPLFHGRVGTAVVFASELGAIERLPGFHGEVDREALTLYLRFNNVPAPWSIYRGIRKLMPGTILTLTADGTERTTVYWSAGEVVAEGLANPFTGDFTAATDALESLLRDAVRRRMIADVPLGVLLSGGVDSSTVAALMQAESGTPVKSFSIGFREQAFNEAEHARAVATHLDTEHHAFTVSAEDALATIPELPMLGDEPFADSSQIPTLLVSRLARRHVTVCLSGDGGDEVFGGYNRYLWAETLIRRAAYVPALLRRTLGGALALVPPGAWDRTFAALRPVLPGTLRLHDPGDKIHKAALVVGAADNADAYRRLVSQWQDPAAAVVGGHEPETVIGDRSAWSRAPDFTRQMMYLDSLTYLPDDILSKVDRASMAVSLEARVPLLDHRVFAFAWTLPMAMKIDGGTSKRILRAVLYRHVPKNLIERPKWGFAIPLHDWLRGPLRGWAEDLLGETRLRDEGYFDAEPVRALWNDHMSGRRNNHAALWTVLMFQAWNARPCALR
jgi:asparagine synthase (glutamine-hydrolysing)